MKRWLVLGLGLPIAAIVAFIVGFIVWNYLTSTTKGDVDKMLRSNVPIGSSASAAIRFLDSKGIAHGNVHTAAPDSELIDAGISPETNVIGGILRNTSHGFFYNVDISFWFILGTGERVVDYYVIESYDGL